MDPFVQHFLEYILISFPLGAVWHVVLFAKYYKKLAIYSRIDDPLFVSGLTAMLLQGIVISYVYPVIGNAWIFGLGLFLTLSSFMVFAEAGKQRTKSLAGFMSIQLAFSFVQALLVTLALNYIPLW